jgi:predicted metal-dependent hydrolase
VKCGREVPPDATSRCHAAGTLDRTAFRGWAASAAPAQTLENWLRRQARSLITTLVAAFAAQLDVSPGRVYIMDQRTKWGSCSALQNRSFNWRIVMAPDEVLR